MENICETRKCKNCERDFSLFDADIAFYEKMQVPRPSLCPSCRQQRRLAWRNEWSLYRRKSSKSGEPIISFLSPDKPQKVFSLKEWFSDDWNGRDFGKDFDFSRPFFEQFRELLVQVPHIPLLMGDCENSDYTNYSLGNKNCYLVSAADYNEDSYYSGYLFHSRSCVDCFFVNDSELCYECTDCEKCYNVMFSQKCRNCADCIGCVNLRGGQNYIFNKKLSREEFLKKSSELLKDPTALKNEFEKFLLTVPTKAIDMQNCQECMGNNLMNCKNCFWSFDLVKCQDCRYVSYGGESKDSMDSDGSTHNELMYETVACPQCYRVRFSTMCWVKSSNLTYCHLCRACQDCFGCVGLHRNKYCILNKQYTKEEYEKLVPRIIEYMKEEGTWGEFFPMWVSPFEYKETVAQDYYPNL